MIKGSFEWEMDRCEKSNSVLSAGDIAREEILRSAAEYIEKSVPEKAVEELQQLLAVGGKKADVLYLLR